MALSLHTIAIAVIQDAAGRVLIGRRDATAHLGGLWEFPGGQVRPDETPAACAIRETREEAGLAITVGDSLLSLDYQDQDRLLHLLFLQARPVDHTPPLCAETQHRWVQPRDLDPAQFPPANAAVIAQLRAGQGDALPLVDLSVRSGWPLALDPVRRALVFGEDMAMVPAVLRQVEDLRPVLREPDATGPSPAYAMSMRIARRPDQARLAASGLFCGAVVIAPGSIGSEWVKTHGHVHSLVPGTALTYPELYEVWHGQAEFLLQREEDGVTTEVMAVPVAAGERLVIPPGYVHVTINTSDVPLVFGVAQALACQLDYGVLRERRGAAYYVLADGRHVVNPRYPGAPPLQHVDASDLPQPGFLSGEPMVVTLARAPERFRYLLEPQVLREAWPASFPEAVAGAQ